MQGTQLVCSWRTIRNAGVAGIHTMPHTSGIILGRSSCGHYICNHSTIRQHIDAQQYIPENENYANLIRNAESRIDRNKITSGALREKIDNQIPFPTDYEN